MIRSHVLICGGTGCTSSGSVKIQKAFAEHLAANGILDEVKIVQTGCFGLCALGPVVIIFPEGTFYIQVTPEDVIVIFFVFVIRSYCYFSSVFIHINPLRS